MALPDTAVLLDAAVLRVLQVRLALALVPATPIFLLGQNQMRDRLGPRVVERLAASRYAGDSSTAPVVESR